MSVSQCHDKPKLENLLIKKASKAKCLLAFLSNPLTHFTSSHEHLIKEVQLGLLRENRVRLSA
ncbi:hypothetical protein SOHN41_03344 [Shewanella sp. HN-41]|nr:hypothetical protein SOHN41_03344 [Shewanella sp. HN-41]